MPVRVALLSDVHGNASAFQAVLDDIRQRGIEFIINMGDTIGYGPEPEKCVDLAMEHCNICLCGNHEYAVMYDAEGFNPVAKGAVEFVRECLEPEEGCMDPDKLRRWEFIRGLKRRTEFAGCTIVHGSPRHEIMEYVLPSDPKMDPLKLDDIFDSMNCGAAFVGHTHFPGIVEEKSDDFYIFPLAEDSYELPKDRKAIINVGSVGQPRDRDVRACYVEFSGDKVWFRRVEYDIEETIRKINESGKLHVSLGLRLREGK